MAKLNYIGDLWIPCNVIGAGAVAGIVIGIIVIVCVVIYCQRKRAAQAANKVSDAI